MRTLHFSLPALTLSFCACSADPSPPASGLGGTSAPDAGAAQSQGSEPQASVSPSDSHSSPSPSQSGQSGDIPDETSAGAGPTASADTIDPNSSSAFTEPNASFNDVSATAPEDTSSHEGPPEVDPPSSTPLGTRNFACDPSPSPMFQGRGVLEMRITADLSVVNGNDKETAVSPGLLDPDGDSGPLGEIPVEVHARGISRFEECGFRPFKVKFAEKQKDNVFQKLGKSVKFTTHCGDKEGAHEILQAPSLDEYYQRVRMEHLVYQLLVPLQTLSLQSRLVRMTYFDTSSGSEQTHLAFVREPEDELGQRCGMAEGEDIPDIPTTLNQRANSILYLLNNFVLQADVKNRFDLVDVEQRSSAPVPYDFDLLGIFRREYAGLDGRTLEDSAVAFADWLRRNQSPALHEEVRLILSKGEVMRQLIAEGELTTTNRALFDEWLTAFSEVLQTFDECESSEGDPNSVACYVPDDHPATVDDADLVDQGEQSLLLEPPGDRDVVRVELEPGKRYTLTTPVHATLRSPSHDVVGALGEQSGNTHSMSLSWRSDSGGMYSVEFDRGDSLVCSDMWSNSPDAHAQPFAVYEDDHGGDFASATRLEAGTNTAGRFELSTLTGLFDEDWFTLSITSDTQVFVTSEGADSAMIESYAVDASDVALGTHYIARSGVREDLTSLFPGPGEYILRVSQGWEQATYSLELSSPGQ